MSDKNHNLNAYERQYSTADITLAARGRISEDAVRSFARIHDICFKLDPPGTLELMGVKLSPAVQDIIQDPNEQTQLPDNVIPINVHDASRAAKDAALTGDEITGNWDNGKIAS